MKSKNNSLEEYQKKRNFEKTSEPKPAIKKINTKEQIFVIQKHAASHLHYDLRLKIDGVLVSWAVPKGPSTDPDDKRLAVRTEDHPLDYATFEGVIPQGQYGGGTVMVWDIGTYENIKNNSMAEALKNGQIEVNLHGKKLKGGFVLIRTHYGDKENWLLKKIKDKESRAGGNPINTKTKSALTGRTMAEIEKDAHDDDNGTEKKISKKKAKK